MATYTLTAAQLNNRILNSFEIPLLDPATIAFTTAAGITGVTEQAAINNLIVGLKADGLWSKMKAVYPFVTDQRNLASYTEGSSAGYFVSCTSITSTTEVSPNNTNTAVRLTYTCALNPYVFQTFTLAANTIYTFSVYMRCPTGNTVVNLNIDSSSGGLGIGNVNVNLTTSWQRYSITFNTLAYSNNFLTVIKGLTTSIDFWGWQLEIGSTATAYQPQLGSAQSAIANQFKYNLVNPVNSDAAFRLVFNGGWTFSTTGALPNGTNGYADTKLNALSVLTNNNYHLSHYSRTQKITGNEADLAAVESTKMIGIDQYYAGVSAKAFVAGDYISSKIEANNTNTLGLLIGTRTSQTLARMFMNNAQVGSDLTLSNPNILPNRILFLGSNNQGTAYEFSSKQIAFSTIGDGLTDTEAANLYTRVQAFQTALSRQV